MQNGRADAVQLPLFDDALRDYELSAANQRVILHRARSKVRAALEAELGP